MLSRRLSLLLALCLLTFLWVLLPVSPSISWEGVELDRPPHRFRPPYAPFRPPDEYLDYKLEWSDHEQDRPSPPEHQGSPYVHIEEVDDHDEETDLSPTQQLWKSRSESVKQAFLFALDGLNKYAPFPHDELRPVSKTGIVSFNGWGVTLVDSLDTMLMMGLQDEFQTAVSQIAQINFSLPRTHNANPLVAAPPTLAPFFETVIRYLGGFLSGYAMSKEPVLLSLADRLADKFLVAFNTTSGLPVYSVNTETNQKYSSYSMLLAEIASCQMEYKYLAHLTGRKEYFQVADRIMDILQRRQPVQGLWSTSWAVEDGSMAGVHNTIGSLADSAYEYLLKQYLMSGKSERRLALMYMKAMNGALKQLLFLSSTRKLLYVTDTTMMAPSRKLEHLSCFFPGLLALGVETLPDDIMTPQERERHMWAAEGLAYTCYIMYADQPSGVGPDEVIFDAWAFKEVETERTVYKPVKPLEELGADELSTDAGGLEVPIVHQVPVTEMVKERVADYESESWMRALTKWEAEGRPGMKPPGLGEPKPIKTNAQKKDYWLSSRSYYLRPETLESMYVLWRTTGDSKWRDRGWEIWNAIETKTRTNSGYANVQSVEQEDPTKYDDMPSYFMAETVKYAYLLTLEREKDPIPVDSWVLNTEAHPIPVFHWRQWERERYNI